MRCLFLPWLVLLFSYAPAQNLANLPLRITVRVQKAEVVRHPKQYFEWEVRTNGYVINTDSVQQSHYQAALSISNTSSQPVQLWMMTCSWDDNLLVNNDYIRIHPWGCDSNFPTLITIQPGDSLKKILPLDKSIKFGNPCQNCQYGPQVETTKIGLIVIDDISKPGLSFAFGYDHAMNDKSAWKIVWSNPLYLLTPAEANPEPVSIPVLSKPRKFKLPRKGRL